MLKDPSKLWWDEITGPSTLTRRIASELQNARSILLCVPEDLPWRKQMRSSVESCLRENSPNLLIDYLDCKTDGIDSQAIFAYILDKYAMPDVKNGYRTSSGITLQQYIIEKQVLQNRILWIKGADCHQVAHWLDFCKKYRAKDSHSGLFVIESYSKRLHGSLPSCICQLSYEESVSYYDALLFNNLLVSSYSTSLQWMQYKATVSSLLCRCDVELSTALIRETDFTRQSPIDVLEELSGTPYYKIRATAEGLDADHPFFLIRSGLCDELKKRIWEAQLQVLFPLIEAERILFLGRYAGEVREALSTPYLDKKGHTEKYITQFGEPISNPQDVEVGTLYRMCHLRRAAQESDYLLFLPKQENRERIELLRAIRNSIAHMAPCPVEQITQFLNTYPYQW